MADVVNVNIEIPELSIKINLNLNQDDLLWDIKQNLLQSIATDLKDGLNHDFYQPPTAFKAAKFLDAERMLREYCMEDGCNLQMIAKRRIYKVLKMDKRKLAEVNTKTSRKKLIQLVQLNSVKKVSKLLDRGLDPNFVEADKGECAMTISAAHSDPNEMLLTLVGKGAHLDFRNVQSFTALHKAACLENHKAIQALLSLGASPNYKDKDSLTPLYHAVMNNKNTHCAEALLKDYALIGSVDNMGYCEIHQASLLGKSGHIDLLLSYGADVNCTDLQGNTPLHLAVKHQQLESARMLLFRGADKECTNLLNQNALHLASFYGYSSLHQLIASHSQQDTTPVKEMPVYNDKSRSTLRKRSHGNLMTSKLKKLSLSSPYLHQSVTNLNSTDARYSIRSFESEGNSTGSADQQFEFDLNNDSRPSSWTKPTESSANPHISQTTTPTSSLRDLHTPMKTSYRSQLFNAISSRAIPESNMESEASHAASYNHTPPFAYNQTLENRPNSSSNTSNYSSNHSSSNRLTASCEQLTEDEYLNSSEVETLLKNKSSKPPLHKVNNSQQHVFQKQHSAPKPTAVVMSSKTSPSKQSDTYLNSIEVNGALKKHTSPLSLPATIIPSPHLLKPTNRSSHLFPNKAPPTFEKPLRTNMNLPLKQNPQSPKSPTFANIPPPPTFPKNFIKPTSPATTNNKVPFKNINKRHSNPTFSPPLPPPPSQSAGDCEFAFPPPPPMF